MKSKRSKATDINSKVRKEVMERDKHCVSCGSRYNLTVAHVFINRSHGGLGVKENLCILCMDCHMKLDHGKLVDSQPIKEITENYLRGLYPEYCVTNLKFRKDIL